VPLIFLSLQPLAVAVALGQLGLDDEFLLC
jgi:hypothetical protein